MIAPRLAVCLLLASSLISAGCNQSGTVESSGGALRQVSPPLELVARAHPPIVDLPVPIGFDLDEGRSRNFAAAGARYVDHLYKGGSDRFAVARFYKRHMPISRWVLVTDRSRNEPLGGAEVAVSLAHEDKELAAFRGKSPGDVWTDPELIGDYKNIITYVLNRKNTVTGVRYRNDKAILAWETGNELHPTAAWTRRADTGMRCPSNSSLGRSSKRRSTSVSKRSKTTARIGTDRS